MSRPKGSKNKAYKVIKSATNPSSLKSSINNAIKKSNENKPKQKQSKASKIAKSALHPTSLKSALNKVARKYNNAQIVKEFAPYKSRIKEINQNLKAIERKYGKEVANYYRDQISLPSSDYISKSGSISTSLSKWSKAMNIQKKALMNVNIPSLKDLKNEAKETLEDSGLLGSLKDLHNEEIADIKNLVKTGEIDQETADIFIKDYNKNYRQDINDLIIKEVQSKILVESDFDSIKEEYYEYMNKYAIQLDNEQEFRDLMAELATGQGSGIKSYSELADWMERAQALIK